MGVPFIDLKRTVAKYRGEIDQAMQSAIDNTAFVGGPPVSEFEAKLSEKTECKYAIGASNGTDALIVALQAVGVKPGMRVAVPNLTFWATVEAVSVLGAEPVFIDCDESLQLSFHDFTAAHEQQPFDAAIMAHLYGWASPRLREFRKYCRKNNIPLVEDSAQAYGVRFADDDTSIFADALISTISFYPAKVIGACGDAGAIATDDEGLAETVRTLINHGRSQHYSYSHIGWNSRMSGLAAAYLNVMLDHDEEILNSRRAAESFYLRSLEGLGDFNVVSPPVLFKTNGYLNVCLAHENKLEEITSRLKDAGIGFGRTYPETMQQQPAAERYQGYGNLETSRSVCSRVFNLPVYAFITEVELAKVLTAF